MAKGLQTDFPFINFDALQSEDDVITQIEDSSNIALEGLAYAVDLRDNAGINDPLSNLEFSIGERLGSDKDEDEFPQMSFRVGSTFSQTLGKYHRKVTTDPQLLIVTIDSEEDEGKPLAVRAAFTVPFVQAGAVDKAAFHRVRYSVRPIPKRKGAICLTRDHLGGSAMGDNPYAAEINRGGVVTHGRDTARGKARRSGRLGTI